MIELSDVAYRVTHLGRPLDILHAVNLQVAAGERVALQGPSGSGKSSLLALIAGVERPTRGSIDVDGCSYAHLDEEGLARFRRERLGIVFQQFNLINALTAWENVALPLELAGRTGAREQAMTWLDRVGLGHRLHHRPSRLSGGEQQRVAIARALVGQPKVILADEPTGSLDRQTGGQILDLLLELVEEWRTTLVLVTHDPAAVARVGAVHHLRDGRL